MRIATRQRFDWKTAAIFLVAVALGVPNMASADIVHDDDVIITFSLCVGNDCASGENFGFDTLRLKENNLRVHFDDTSDSSSFPNRDWRLLVNDSTNGGINRFSIEDSDGGTIPFTIEGKGNGGAGVPTNSLYVRDNGNIGLGNSVPMLPLHITDGNSPGIRLEQDGSSGFTAQSWDVAGNETNFFVRDVTNGSNLPFRIKPSAPSDSLFIAEDGDVGLGTSSPATGKRLDVKFADDSNGGGVQFRNNDGSFEVVNGTGAPDNFLPLLRGNSKVSTRATIFQGNGADGDDAGNVPLLIFRASVNEDVVATRPLIGFQNFTTTVGTIDSAGNMNLNGDVTANSVLLTSSRELKQDIGDLSAEKAGDALAALTPVEYAFKARPDEKHVGFIAEDVPELVAHKSRKVVPAMEIIAVVTKVVKDQQKTIAAQQQRIDELSKKIETLAAAE
jgi:hypothetical protein